MMYSRRWRRAHASWSTPCYMENRPEGTGDTPHRVAAHSPGDRQAICLVGHGASINKDSCTLCGPTTLAYLISGLCHILRWFLKDEMFKCAWFG